MRYSFAVCPSVNLGKGVRHVVRAAHTWNCQKVIEGLLVVVILLGLVYLVYWVITEEPRPRYPGIEKLRGHSAPRPLSYDFASLLCDTAQERTHAEV